MCLIRSSLLPHSCPRYSSRLGLCCRGECTWQRSADPQNLFSVRGLPAHQRGHEAGRVGYQCLNPCRTDDVVWHDAEHSGGVGVALPPLLSLLMYASPECRSGQALWSRGGHDQQVAWTLCASALGGVGGCSGIHMRNTPINATTVGTSIPTQMLRVHVGHDKAAGQDGSIGQPQYSAG